MAESYIFKPVIKVPFTLKKCSLHFIFLAISLLLPICSCGFVAYSTEFVQKENAFNSYTLKTFHEIWRSMFMWAFFSIFIVYILAFVIAVATLQKHRYGRYAGFLILVYGTVSALLASCITSAVVTYVLYQAKFVLYPMHTMLSGFCQLGVYLFISFFTLKPTL